MNSSKWFVCPYLNPGADALVFFFPYAGGGPAVFGKWMKPLPERLEGWGIHYPGRGARYLDPPLRRVNQFVEHLVPSIQQLLDKPFAFFGHSFGALIAFELAQALRRANLPQPKTLFVSACGAPHLPDPNPPLHTLPPSEFLDALEKLNGIPPEIIQNAPIMKELIPVLRADFEAAENYQFDSSEPPLNIPILAFGGLDDPRVSRERLEGWASQTNSMFKSHYFPGGHFFVNSVKESIIEIITTSSDGKT